MGTDQKRQVKGMAVYQKAYICPYRNNSPVLGEKFYVPFNPSEIVIDEAIGVLDEEDNGLDEVISRLWQGSGFNVNRPLDTSFLQKRKCQLTLSVTLFFNTLTSLYQESYEDVRTYISRLYPYTNKTAKSGREVEHIYFFWGSIAVAGILSRMNVRYTMFAPDGKPVRAQADITIVGNYVGESSGAGIRTESEGELRSAKNDTAFWSAVDPSLWRDLYSGINNPRLQI